MEALISKLFILTAEASIVFLLIIIVMIIFNIKAKRKDLKTVKELITTYTKNKEERISTLKKQLNTIGFKGNSDEHAEKLFQHEKTIIKEFVTLYLRHDIYRLLDYPENISENNDLFLKTSGSGQAVSVTKAPDIETSKTEDTSSSEETANATIQAREQAESEEVHLKELSELRLKNTELNEHLFEALETITDLMTEHGKKTGQEVDSNAQKVLQAIIYLRDKRLENGDNPSKLAPSTNDTHDQIDSFNLDAMDDFDSDLKNNSVSVDLDNNDATLDDSTAVNLGINEELNVDLDTLDEDEAQINPSEPEAAEADEADPWADALAEQATAETDAETPINLSEPEAAETDEADPWADALAEQATAETDAETPINLSEPEAAETDEADPWADALAEQATAETDAETPINLSEPEAAETDETDPWADALAEQATAETDAETPINLSESEAAETDEADPWADALAEQATAEAENTTSAPEEDNDDPWASALAEQEKAEKK